MIKRFLYGLWLVMLCCCGNAPIQAQCDETIRPTTDDVISYKYRQNRCEGFYIAEVSGRLEVVGFIKGNFKYELDPKEQIKVTPETQDEINIRAVGIPMTLYYRMDGKASQGQSLVWSVGDVLYKRRVPSYNIGIYGWILDGQIERYIPVQTRATISEYQVDDIYRIYLRSSSTLSDLRWKVCGANNKCTNYQEYSQENIMAGQRIILEIPQDLNGDCVLEIATMDPGASDFEKRKIYFRI